jgi:transcriptional regulator with XRE-family HTH domain
MEENVSQEILLSPAQVRAARALLAWSQQDLSKHAHVGVSTVADFERGQRTPVPNNSEAIRIALEKAGITFLPGGAVHGPQSHFVKENRSTPGGMPIRWVNATGLAQWADRRDSQGRMPEVLTRLIRAATGMAATLHFPSDESVQLSGWDGVCDITHGTEYISSGRSGWEIGTQREGITGKASDDYKKRTANPLGIDPAHGTFVFVTPRRWRDKEQWVRERQKEGKWADVRAYDADDLVHWLELYPAVGFWLAVLMGRRPAAGLLQLEEAWQEWSLSTQCPLSIDLILAGRDEDAAHVLRWLRGEPSVLAMQGESPDEAIAFLYAAIEQLPSDYRVQYKARCLFATTLDAARTLGDSISPLVIILDNAVPGLAQRLAAQGHHIYIAYGSDVGTSGDIRQLARPSRYAIAEALEDMGIEKTRAENLAHDSERSLAVLRRLMPSAPGRVPKWAETPVSRGLLAALLAGAWNEETPGDKAVLERLSGEKYDVISAELARWVGVPDSPIRKAGSTWKIASPRDAWVLLARHLTGADFERFEAVVLDVLSSTDPRFDMEADERWYAPVKGVRPECSELLRRGLAETLILFSVFEKHAPSVSSSATHVEYIVRKVFEGADSKRWWSMSRDFTFLAEAAPEAFLAAIDDSLDQNPSPITVLFGKDGSPLGGDYISHLLWALELLAWSPHHLSHTAAVLAKLASLDQGGDRFHNQPANGLRQIFLLWLPQTYASLDQRLRVLDYLLKIQADVAWRLILDIFPKNHDTSNYSPQPRWRDFSVDQHENVTDALIWKGAEELTKRLLNAVGLDPDRWKQLIIEALPNLAPARRMEVIQLLSEVAPRIQDDETRSTIWAAIRQLLHRHREFLYTAWALPAAELDMIEKIYNTLEPVDLIKKYAWLFASNVLLPRPSTKHVEGQQTAVKAWRADEEEAVKQRILSVSALYAHGGIDAVFALAHAVEMPYLVGVAAAELKVKAAERDAILERGLKGHTRTDENFVHGMIVALHKLRGERWASRLLAKAVSKKWGTEPIVRILHALPRSRKTWEKAATIGREVEDRYWKQCNIYSIDLNGDDVAFAVEKLIGAGRARYAIHIIGQAMETPLRTELILRTLTETAKESWINSENGNDLGMFQHYVIEIFKKLDDIEGIPEDQIIMYPENWTGDEDRRLCQ